jgi:hypothetical protein
MTWRWIAASLAGRFDWLRTGRRRVWREARAHFESETRALVRQLNDAERELAWRREVDHVEARNPHGWGNGAGYQSRRHDFPSRPSSEVSNASA